jgi:hypothetical protein
MASLLLVNLYPWEPISPLVSARPGELTTHVLTQCKSFALHTWPGENRSLG